jgi:hypothetical protein
VQAGVAAHHFARALAENAEQHRAQQWAPHRARPADDRAQQDLHGVHGPEGDGGVDVGEVLGVEGAAEGGDAGGERHRGQLDSVRVDAEGGGRRFVLAHGGHLVAEAGAAQACHTPRHREQHGENHVVEIPLIAELEQRGRVTAQRHENAHGAAYPLPVRGRHAKDLREGEHHEREVRPPQAVAERQMAGHDADGDGEGGAHPHPDPRAHPGLQETEAGGVGADAEEERVSERELAGVAAEDVPSLAHEAEEEHEREGAHDVLGADEQRSDERRRQQRPGGDAVTRAALRQGGRRDARAARG